MPTTTPDNIYYADSTTTMSAEAISAAEATSVQAALSRITSSVSDFTALAALSTSGLVAGNSAYVTEGAVTMQWSGTVWRQVTTSVFASTVARDTAYAKASGAYRVEGVRAVDTSTKIEYVCTGTSWRIESMPWAAPTLGTGITNRSGFETAKYRIQDRSVEIVAPGLDGSAGSGFTLMTLPAGFRPSATVRASATSGTFVEISASGDVSSSLSGVKTALAFYAKFPV